MDGRSPKSIQCMEVVTDRVALVLSESIAWMTSIELLHQAIARGFGENGRRCDREALAIALDNRLLCDRQILDAPRVGQDVLRPMLQPFNRSPHSQNARPIDIECVDFFHLDKG